MYKFNQEISIIEQQKLRIFNNFNKNIFHLLDAALDIFLTYLPDVNFNNSNDVISASDYLEIKTTKLREWLDTILIPLVKTEYWAVEHQITPPIEQVPISIAKKTLKCFLELLSCGRDFQDNDYYSIDRFRKIVNLTKRFTLKTIEQVQYENRKKDYEYLLKFLDREERFNYALLLYKAIQIDDKVHPAELKYMQYINQLLGNDEETLEIVEKECMITNHIPPIKSDNLFSDYLFQHLVEIVLCDEDYDPKESDFIKRMAEMLSIDESIKENIEHETAASIMTKSTLFHDA